MTASSSRGQHGARLDRSGDEGRRLAADHVEVQLHGHRLGALAGPDVEVLALAQRQAGVVVEAHQSQDLGVGEAQVGEAVQRLAAQGEEHVAGVDRLGDAVQRPESRPVAALAVAVLDVVVDQAEVVAQLHGRRAGQGRPEVAGDRGVGQQPQQRAHPLAGAAAAVEAQVVAHHLEQAGGGRLAVVQQAHDLALCFGQQLGQANRVFARADHSKRPSESASRPVGRGGPGLRTRGGTIDRGWPAPGDRLRVTGRRSGTVGAQLRPRRW